MKHEVVPAAELTPKTLRAQDYMGIWPHMDHEITKACRAVELAKRKVARLERTRMEWALEHAERRRKNARGNE